MREVTLPSKVFTAGKQTAEALRSFLFDQLATWGLLPQAGAHKLYTTTDRGTNIQKAIAESSRLLHVPCFSHVLHRAVLGAFEEIRIQTAWDPIATVVKIAAHFN